MKRIPTLVLLLVVLLLSGCGRQQVEIRSLEDMKNMSIIIGVSDDIDAKDCIEEFCPNAKILSLYDNIVYDSDNERNFAANLDSNKNVAVYVTLPDGFYISTPVGRYNPDWAIAFYEGNVKHIYFVAETKGSMSSMQLRQIEESKIHCAREHFKAISNGNIVYDVVDNYDELLKKVLR